MASTVETERRYAAWMARCTGRGETFPFTPAEMQELISRIGVTQAPAGTPLMEENGAVPSIGLILSGEVELYRRSRVRRVVLQVLREGDMYGDIPMFCRMPAPFNARALTDAELLVLDAGAFGALLERHPHIAQRFLFSLASRLARMQRRLLEVMAGDLRSQVAALLVDETGEDQPIVHLSQSTIAEMLGATRPSVNRVLKQFEAEGALALSYRRVEVLDRAALQAA